MEKEKCKQEDLDYLLHTQWIPWEELEGKTILVTGSTGLIGFHLVRALLHASREKGLGVRVIAQARDKEKGEWMYRDLLPHSGLEFFWGNVETLPQVDGPVDYIVHGAGVTASREMVERPVETIWTTVQGMRNLLELAREKKTLGVVFLSSMEVYGRQTSGEVIGEDCDAHLDPGNLRDCYPVSKALAESLCVSYAREYGIRTSCLRLSQVLGCLERRGNTGEKKIIQQIFDDIRNGRDIRLLTKGGSKRTYVYIRDAISAILVALLKGEGFFNVSDEESYCSVRELCEMAVHELAEDRIRVVVEGKELPQYPKENFLNLTSKRLRSLGWQPSVGLREALWRIRE